MPTLPLYSPADVPDASHRVLAPGGYETWHFHAESAGGDARLVAVLGVGSPIDVTYLRRYLQYRRRPTRCPPPVPAEHPFAHAAVYDGGRLLAEFTAHADPSDFAASPHEPAVKVAGNEFVRERDGSLSLRLRGVASRGASSLSAQLVFRPLLPHPPWETSRLGQHISPALHRWVIAAPRCDVSGTVALTPGGDGSRGGAREIDFRGRGYHDHCYGTAPLAGALRRWAVGHAFLGDATYAFHVARPLERALPDDVQWIRCDAEGARAVQGDPLHVVWTAGRGLRPPYPAELTAGNRLRLVRPRVVDSDASHARLLYHASAHGSGENATAWCETFQPQRSVPMLKRWAAKVE